MLRDRYGVAGPYQHRYAGSSAGTVPWRSADGAAGDPIGARPDPQNSARARRPTTTPVASSLAFSRQQAAAGGDHGQGEAQQREADVDGHHRRGGGGVGADQHAPCRPRGSTAPVRSTTTGAGRTSAWTTGSGDAVWAPAGRATRASQAIIPTVTAVVRRIICSRVTEVPRSGGGGLRPPTPERREASSRFGGGSSTLGGGRADSGAAPGGIRRGSSAAPRRPTSPCARAGRGW